MYNYLIHKTHDYSLKFSHNNYPSIASIGYWKYPISANFFHIGYQNGTCIKSLADVIGG